MHADSFRLNKIYRVQMRARNRILFLSISYLSHVFDDIFLRSKEEDLTKPYFEARRIIFRWIYHTSDKLMGFPLKNIGKAITFSSFWRQIHVLPASVLSSCRITTPSQACSLPIFHDRSNEKEKESGMTQKHSPIRIRQPGIWLAGVYNKKNNILNSDISFWNLAITFFKKNKCFLWLHGTF